MKKIYITGVSGTGKSAIAKELEKRGIFAFSIDEAEGMCKWVNRQTQQVAGDYQPTIDWLNAHDWICDVEKLKELIGSNDLVIATGIATNQDDFLPLFDKVLLLQCSKKTFLERVELRQTRPGENEFGKHQVERDYMAAIHEEFDKKMLDRGAVSINAENPIEMVIDEILSKI